MGKQKRIGILTSGGDCPGLNAVIRAVVSHATLTYDWEVLSLQCGMGQYIANQIANCNNNQLDIRVSVLGHIQRGGIPSALDRLIATAFGKAAVDLVAQGQYDRMVAWQNGQVAVVAIKDVLARSPLFVDRIAI